MTSKDLVEGAVFKIDLHSEEPNLIRRKPPHYWIILEHPWEKDASFLIVSLTDYNNQSFIFDHWPALFPLTEQFSLSKKSVISVMHTRVVTAKFILSHPHEYMGRATNAALSRARCNLHWYREFLKGEVLYRVNWHGKDWTRRCAPKPQHPTS